MDNPESLLSRLSSVSFIVWVLACLQLVVYLDKSRILAKKFGWNLQYWHYIVFLVLIYGLFILLPNLIQVIVGGASLLLGIGYQIGKAKR